MSKYYIFTHSFGGSVIGWVVDDVLRWIPFDVANTDYQRYLDWVAEGNEAEPWDPENPPV